MPENLARAGRAGPRLRVAHVSVFRDPLERNPEELLDAWSTLADVARAVADRGASVTVIQAAKRDQTLEEHGVLYRFVRTPPTRMLHRRAGFWATPASSALLSVLRSEAPDVVHFHSLSFPRHLRLVARTLPKVPVLVQDHSERPPPPWLRPLARRGLRTVAGATFTCREQADAFFRAGLFHPDLPVYVVPESSSRFIPGDRQGARATTGLEGDPAFLWIGHLDDNKDPLTVLDAAASAFPLLPDPRLWLVFQRAPLLERVKRRVAESAALRGRVHLLGEQPHARVEPLLRAADFFVLASHREGSGFALIEALACGTPPIVSDIPSFRQLTGFGAVGATFPPGDAPALADRMCAMPGRDSASHRLATRRHFDAHVSFDVVGRSLVDAYVDLLDRHGAGSRGSTGRADPDRPGA